MEEQTHRHRPGSPVRSGIPEHGRIPKYYAVKARISELLDELGEGGALPTERDLAERYEVSRETVRQALRELLLEGGCAARPRDRRRRAEAGAAPLLASYTEGVRRQGRRPGRHLIGLEQFPCPPDVAPGIGAAPGEAVWHLERVLLADDERVGLESTYIRVARAPRLDVDFQPDSSFYGYLRDSLGISFGEADEKLETVLATPREALLIGTLPPSRCCSSTASRGTRTAGRWSGSVRSTVVIGSASRPACAPNSAGSIPPYRA